MALFYSKLLSTGAEDVQTYTILGALFAAILLLLGVSTRSASSKTPVLGRRSAIEPRIFVRWRFMSKAPSMIFDGYDKFKKSAFTILRNDMDLLVLPVKYLDELRSMSDEILDKSRGTYRNHNGRYSLLKPMLESDILTRTLSTKMVPNLGALVANQQEELTYAMSVEVPNCKATWKQVDLWHIILAMVSRSSARMIVGLPLCRDKRWLKASVEYTENAIGTTVILRFFPSFMHPLVYPFLPMAWKALGYLKDGKRMIVPLVEKRRLEKSQNPDHQKPNDFLQWMMDGAINDNERDPNNLAHRELLVSQGAIHSTAMAVTQALYDLCAHPEYQELLKAEIREHMPSDGQLNQTALFRMQKLDSFMKESQRLSPPQLLSGMRHVRKPITLSDGMHIAQGTQICMPTYALTQDPDIVPSPECFDGLRHYNKRQSDPSEANKHQFSSVDQNTLHFGYGRHSCPGRLFASNSVKTILILFLTRFELKLREGEERPKNVTHDEMVFPDFSVRVLIREQDGLPEKEGAINAGK